MKTPDLSGDELNSFKLVEDVVENTTGKPVVVYICAGAVSKFESSPAIWG